MAVAVGYTIDECAAAFVAHGPGIINRLFTTAQVQAQMVQAGVTTTAALGDPQMEKHLDKVIDEHQLIAGGCKYKLTAGRVAALSRGFYHSKANEKQVASTDRFCC